MNDASHPFPDDAAKLVGAFCLSLLALPFILIAATMILGALIAIFLIYPSGYGTLIEKAADLFDCMLAQQSPVSTT